jgi:hypothetical protein
MKGWWKKWFYLRNDASTSLPVFISGRPIPLPSGEDGVDKKDLGKLHTLRENLQQLWQDGLTGMSTALEAEDQDVDVSETKLPQSPLL